MHNIFYLIKKIIAACSKNEIYNKKSVRAKD